MVGGAAVGAGGSVDGHGLTTSVTVRHSGRRAVERYRTWRRRFGVQQAEFYLYRLGRVVPGVHRLLRRLFVADLRGLNDILAGSPLAERYWIWAGLVLGWAREGQVLSHDDMDADFAVLEEDWALLEQAVEALERGGYRGVRRFVNHRGQVTEVVFMRHGARFEFFKLWPVGDMVHYTVYGRHEDANVEIEEELPRQDTEEFSFLGRIWRKVRDHESELAFLYCDWQTPDRNWSYMSTGRHVVGRQPWDPTTSRW
jgi:hypothetical protein